MVRADVDELKARAFTLSKILTAYKVKLSSQQCLDVLSELTSNVPYEALRAQRLKADMPSAEGTSSTLASWLEISDAFCGLVSSLDREAVSAVAFQGEKFRESLHRDGRSYLLAAGNAAGSFSRSAKDFVAAQSRARRTVFPSALRFKAECGDPVPAGVLAMIRVQNPGGERSESPHFEDLSWKRGSDGLLFGAEGRIELTAEEDLQRPLKAPYSLTPGVRLTYEVCGQEALEAFVVVLRSGVFGDLWDVFPSMRIETRILLSKDHFTDSLEEDWSTADPDCVERLINFCERAHKLTEEETRDWPPYLRIVSDLDRSNSDEDLHLAYRALCLHVSTMYGSSGGLNELLEEAQLRGVSNPT